MYKTYAYCSIASCKSQKPNLKAMAQAGETEDDVAQRLGLSKTKQPDILYMQDILVSVGENLNEDVFLPNELIDAVQLRETVKGKPVNWEHKEQDIIGVMVDSRIVDKDGKIIADASELDNFDVISDSMIWKQAFPERAAEIILGAQNGEIFVSMEAYFQDYDYAVGNSIVKRNSDTSFLDNALKAHGGPGEWQGDRVRRVLRNITFAGKGIVRKPANPDSLILTVASDPEPIENFSQNKIAARDIISDVVNGPITGGDGRKYILTTRNDGHTHWYAIDQGPNGTTLSGSQNPHMDNLDELPEGEHRHIVTNWKIENVILEEEDLFFNSFGFSHSHNFFASREKLNEAYLKVKDEKNNKIISKKEEIVVNSNREIFSDDKTQGVFMEERIKELEKQVKDLLDTNKQLEEKAAQAGVDKYEDRIKELETDQEENLDKVTKLEKTVEDMKTEKTKASEDFETVQKENDELKTEKEKLEVEVKAKEEEARLVSRKEEITKEFGLDPEKDKEKIEKVLSKVKSMSDEDYKAHIEDLKMFAGAPVAATDDDNTDVDADIDAVLEDPAQASLNGQDTDDEETDKEIRAAINKL